MILMIFMKNYVTFNILYYNMNTLYIDKISWCLLIIIFFFTLFLIDNSPQNNKCASSV